MEARLAGGDGIADSSAEVSPKEEISITCTFHKVTKKEI